MTQEYTIEEGSFNFCGLKWIHLGGTKYNPQPCQAQEDDEDRIQTNKVVPISIDAIQHLQTALTKELQKTNRSLKVIAWALAILTVILFLTRHLF